MFETIIIDDVVDIETQREIHKVLMEQADWKFLNDVSGIPGQTYPSHGFVHILYHPDPYVVSTSILYDKVSKLILDSLTKLGYNIKDNYYNRAFLQLPLAEQYKKEHNGVHVDLPSNIPHVACVYYVNGSDGDTIIFEQTVNDTPGGSTNIELTEHKRVTPKRGRLVMFDGSRYHCSSQPTINYRCIINFDLIMNQWPTRTQ